MSWGVGPESHQAVAQLNLQPEQLTSSRLKSDKMVDLPLDEILILEKFAFFLRNFRESMRNLEKVRESMRKLEKLCLAPSHRLLVTIVLLRFHNIFTTYLVLFHKTKQKITLT